MKKVAIYGAGGFGKEVRGMVDFQKESYSFGGYFDDFKEVSFKIVNDDYDDVFIAIADPVIRHKIISTWSKKNVPFSALIHPNVHLHSTVSIERGGIVCPGVQFTVDIKVGAFSIINLNSTIGHDVVMGDFCSIMPAVNISGNVTIGNQVFIGSGATILQGVTLGDGAIVGAGAVVTKNVVSGQTVIGIPARKLKR